LWDADDGPALDVGVRAAFGIRHSTNVQLLGECLQRCALLVYLPDGNGTAPLPVTIDG